MKLKVEQLSLFVGLTYQELDLIMLALIRAIDLYEDIKGAHIFARSAYDYLLCDSNRVISHEQSIKWGMMLLGEFDEKSSQIDIDLEEMYSELEAVRNLLQSKISD